MTDAAIVAGPGGEASPGDEVGEVEHAIEEKAFGFWVYLMSDAIIFSLLFATYAVMSDNTAGGPSGHMLFRLPHTVAETALLLTSSTTFGFASVAIAASRRWQALAWLGVTFLLGLGFVGMEVTEFVGLAMAGAGPDRSGFLSAFFTLVGTHGMHVTVGLIWIVLLGCEAAMRGLTPYVISRLYRLGLFWHFLDIVWIGIFSVVYLQGIR
jgi:cytochrome o ubiquinol oxidase subunit 3